MDEDLSVKAPVTRLRRRMSVEAEDSPLPTTPSTPTKKRSTRLAAKSQLELIDEVATENVPKRTTRKAVAKENLEADSNTATPTPSVTPSRRNTRIRSNTSILLETTTQNVESPRTKRALRRNSQLGSDTESAITPARQTRRTRKDSTTSVDKQAGDENVVVNIAASTNSEPSTEDPVKGTPVKDSEAGTDDQSPIKRKSPRLQNKISDCVVKIVKADIKTDKTLNDLQNNVKTTQASPTNKNNNIEKKDTAIPVVNKAEIEILSTSDTKLDNEIKSKNKTDSALNTSSSASEKIAMDLKNKKNRTKSWTTLSSPASKSGFISDNEVKLKSKTPNTSLSGSGDGLLSSDEHKNLNESNIKSPNKSLNASKSAKVNTLENNDLAFQVVIDELESQKSDTVKLFENSPNNQQPMVLIEDSDSCSGKLTMDIQIEGEDQCVPVVINQSTNKSPSKCEQSVEAMEIDESMPVNVTIDDFSDKSNTSKEDVEVADKRKSSVSEESMLKNESVENLKKKSFISIQTVKENKNDSINKSKNDFSDKLNTSKEDVEVANKIKLSVSEKSMLINESIENPKRKSSISIQTIQENKKDSINKSINSSILSDGNTSTYIQEKFNNSSKEKPNRSSLVTQVADLLDLNESRKLDTSQKKASISTGGEDKEKQTKRKSSVSLNNSAIDQDVHESRKSLNNTQMNESSSKSKRTSSISQTNLEINQNPIMVENNDSQNLNKSKRSSLISQTGSHNLEQTENENKSTLIISQLKDVSTSINNAMSPNATINELSKSKNDFDVKNKSIDKNKTTLSYLTSTPIQQKPLQKLTMQINTSIISPGAENKNEKTLKKDIPKQSHDSDSLSETDDEIKFKNNVKDKIVALNKYSRAQSSSESSEDEPNTKSKIPIKRVVKNSPNKKVPALESSDSEEESDSKSHKNNKLTPKKELSQSDSVKKLAKKVQALESSDSDELDSESHQGNKKTPNKNNDSKTKPESKHIVKKVNKNSSAKISDDSDLDEEASNDKSKMVDDEASEASDDYESGDSQSEENKRYEAENEIVEKGETLDSDEELSNDSEYEKDSFIVSSDAEDNEILSGTGDDLSMSDNELTMSAKSKNKFNERKLKQQKKASKEMYEARHQGKESAKSKKKRQRLESSTLESEDENTQPKKSNRQRIDSSQDISMEKSDAEESIVIKKKKSKRLSESVHDITTNEKEITILNQSNIEKNDPLTVTIKQELKTPQKRFNMSIVAINDKIEEVQIDTNASLIRRNETIDPLHATMIEDDIEDSSSSDNGEIIQNYDSILNSLNTQTKKIKTMDTSLNLNKKSKYSKNPVIDQLNLTQTKKIKKNKNKTTEDKSFGTLKTKAKDTSKIDFSNEDFSDSIDMKLLFPEDSNDSEINASQFKPELNKEPEEYFIPLKRTDGQTNIPGNMDMNTSALNSSKKNKKRKSSHCDPNEVPTVTYDTEEPEDSNIKIFIDTKGTHEQSDTSMVLSNSSKKKKNKKNMFLNEESEVLESAIEIDCTDGITETPVEISFASEKKKMKNKNKSLNLDVSVNNADITITESHSEKKSKKKLDSIPQFIETVNENMDDIIETPVEISFSSDKKKKKNKSTNLDVSVNNADIAITESQSEKKSKKKLDSIPQFIETFNENMENTVVEEMPANISIKSDKKKKKNKNDVSLNIEPAVESMNSAKKNKKFSTSLVDDVLETQNKEPEEIPAETSLKSDKKKKKKKNNEVSQITDAGEDSDGAPVEMSYKSEKKSDCTDAVTDETLTSSEKKKHKKNKKKKKQNKNLSQSMEKSDDNVKVVEQDGDASTKRKRKASGNSIIETENEPVQNLSGSHGKKKRKIHLDNECIAAYNDTELRNSEEVSLKKSKKNKKSKNHDNEGSEQDDVQKNISKKRKNRDDDNEEQIHKVSKKDSFDKIHVPKLPESVINQLTEKPHNKVAQNKRNKKKTSNTVIATMPFVVEEAERRRNKPSNYLEQSIYLNDSPVKTKQKRAIDKPKVLPFIPTALTSDSGYTSKFNINVLPGQTQFVAQSSNAVNFRESFLGDQRIKKLGTFERCKVHRSQKISKF